MEGEPVGEALEGFRGDPCSVASLGEFYLMTDCERCRTLTDCVTGSWFNQQMICPACEKEEAQHPDFEQAKASDNAACQRGEFNFSGIGLPTDLVLKYTCKCTEKRTISGNRCTDCHLPLKKVSQS